ncbi:MAG TPA: caspase family protein [Allosphingosinicella sp.]|jgi:hypothetical protein
MADALVRVPDSLGLWQSATGGPGARGAHALVVGISDYPFLSGGTEAHRVQDSHGLLQLQVSAKTAARVFGWLRKRGSIAGRPLATCRLLLAPQPGPERDYVERATQGHFASPDFETLRRAILDWGNEFLAPDAAGQPDRASFFFFSGHGLEHLSVPVLLARDYLEPLGNQGYRRAVGIRELRDAIRTYNVSAAYYFLDACRNSSPELQRLTRNGQAVLDPESDPVVFPDPNAWIQATAPGQLAYQKNDPEAPATFFGQALIEGLAGHGPTFRPYDLAIDPCSLRFGELDSFVKERTRELLREVNPQLTQSVKAGGDPYEEAAVLTAVPRTDFAAPPRPRARRQRQTPELSHRTKSFGAPSDIETRGAMFDGGGLGRMDRRRTVPRPAPQPSPPSAPSPPPSPAAELKTRLDRAERGMSREVPVGISVVELGPGRLHDTLPHEWLSHPWETSFRLGIDGVAGPSAEVRIEAMRTTEAATTVCIWADVLVTRTNGSRDPLWLLLGRAGGEWAPKGILIPYDQSPLPVRIEAVFERVHETRAQLIQFSGRIGPPELLGDANAGAREHWAQLWEAQQRESFLHVAAAREALAPFIAGAHGALLRKSISRTAAALGAAILLQCGANEQLHDWPRNLADSYGSPDGAILWAETLFRRGAVPGTASWAEAMEYFGRAGDALPQLVPTLEIAATRAGWLRQEPQRRHVTAQADAAIDRLDQVIFRLLPSGRFASFDAPDAALAAMFN